MHIYDDSGEFVTSTDTDILIQTGLVLKQSDWEFEQGLRSYNLTKVELGNGIRSIAKDAFYSCGFLREVIFSSDSDITEIGESAFNQCINLTSITIPKSVTKIDKDAFYHCEKLNEIILKEIF